LEAVDALTAANRLERDGGIERRLVPLRHEAFGRLDLSPRPSPWPDERPRPPTAPLEALPTREAAELMLYDFSRRSRRLGSKRSSRRTGRALPVLRPAFEPGDALLFDEPFLHRTAVSPGMTRERYAIETWFFAPSVYPGKQIPLVW
jgi:hypothetical protein